MFEIVCQALTRRSHAELIQTLLALPGLRRGIVSAAFTNASGVALVEEALRAVRARVDAFIGIRNDVTSAQGLKRLLPIVNNLFIIDTGSRNRIFHPKVYLVRSDTAAQLVVGSANLTTGGLWNNIEASLKLQANLQDPAQRIAIERFEAQLDALPWEHPQHVVAVTTDAEIDALLAAGRVVDESVAERPRPMARGGSRDADTVPRMDLPLPAIRPPVQQPRQAPRGRARRLEGRVRAPPNVRSGYELVWESRELHERDLNIPSGANTNPTGSMLLKKGRLEDIDQRHFFRDEIFAGLDWRRDERPHLRHWERASATFRVIIKNLDYGKFELPLSHNSNTTSRSYAQRNAMTQIHWRQVREHIARRDLLGRTLYLYRDREQSAHFIIEID